jgi:flagellar FliJ protein
MKRFKFNLEEVLQLRKFREEECKLALGQAVAALNMIENEIRETAVKRHNAASNRFADVVEMTSWENYILWLDRQTQKLMEQAAQAEIIVEEKRALFIEAERKLNTMEKLREKQQKEYRKEAMYLQMAEVDDITASRYR